MPQAPQVQHPGYSKPPTTYVLEQNFPNPFNPTTNIRYYLPKGVNVRLDIYNLMGQRVATLADTYQDAGEHTALWIGQGFASGVYIYQLHAGGQVQTKKMLLLK